MRYVLILLVALGAMPAAADPCDDLWFTRNLIMDRAGYCFGTPLGRAVFDNANCTGKSVSLDGISQRLVDTLRQQERALGCAVDTGRRQLYLPDFPFRWQIGDLPVADEYESGCIGWQEAVTPLYSGRGAGARVVGRIEPGDDLLYRHWPVDDWNYVIVHDPGSGRVKAAGWLGFQTTPSSCRNWAG